MSRSIVKYSEALKLQVVGELEDGKLESVGEARRRYGITGGATVTGWLRKYGKNHLLPRIIRVEKPEERDQIKALKRRIKELEKALVRANVQMVLSESFFEVACEEFGVTDIEALKKRYDTKLLEGALKKKLPE